MDMRPQWDLTQKAKETVKGATYWIHIINDWMTGNS
jgi:hypothetical protein